LETAEEIMGLESGAPGNAPERIRKALSKVDRGIGPSGFPRRRYRAVWISDVHLGTHGCNDRMLIDFLDHVDCDTLYLVGDIIDGWRLKKRFYWPERHNAIVRRVMQRAKHGTRVVYVPGNHDEMFRQFAGTSFGGVQIRRKAIHTTADGRRLLILHGDEFDAIVMAHRWLAFLGDAAYTLLLKLNVVVNAVRRRLDLPYWSLSKHAKHKVKNAVAFVSRFEEAVAHEAARLKVDGIVCGHIHTAEERRFGDICYYNDGDWVESCTALVEHRDGRMEILHWAEEIAARAAAKPLKEAA
jgi:UDP-2,3-diacylglucosamine pyrophosphatase LpxH